MSAVCSKCEHSGNIIGAAAAPRKVCVPISTHLRLGFALYPGADQHFDADLKNDCHRSGQTVGAVCWKCQHSGNIIGAAPAPREVRLPFSTHLRLGLPCTQEQTSILMSISRMTVTEVAKPWVQCAGSASTMETSLVQHQHLAKSVYPSVPTSGWALGQPPAPDHILMTISRAAIGQLSTLWTHMLIHVSRLITLLCSTSTTQCS